MIPVTSDFQNASMVDERDFLGSQQDRAGFYDSLIEDMTHVRERSIAVKRQP